MVITNQQGAPTNLQAQSAGSVVPSDSNELAWVPAHLFVGISGDVSVDMWGTGSSVVFKNVPSGTVLNILVRRVRVTDTTATDIVALW